MKRVLMIVVMAVTVLSCGRTQPPATIPAAAAKLTVWHYWTEADPVLKQFAAEFGARNNCAIEIVLFSSLGDQYQQQLKTAAAENRLPDIIGVPGAGPYLSEFVTGGFLRKLSEDIVKDGWGASFYPEALHAFRYFEGNPYGITGGTLWAIPFSMMHLTVYYNQTLLKEQRIDFTEPQTMEELLALAKKLKSKGIKPFVSGFGDDWLLEYFTQIFLYSHLGEQGMKRLYSGQMAYDSPDVVAAFRDLSRMKRELLEYPLMTTMENKRAEYSFSHRQAAMAFNGSWALSVCQAMNPNIEIGFFRLPVFSSAKFTGHIPGGAGKGWAVNKNAPADLAIRFLRYLTEPEIQRRHCLAINELPAVRGIQFDDPNLSRMAGLNQYVMPIPDQEELPEIRKEIINQVRKLLDHRISYEVIGPAVQKLKIELGKK